MKLIVKEHISAVVQPVVKTYTIVTEATDSINRIPLSIGLEKGDLLVYTGAGQIARLPVGSNGQVLKADSTTPLGIKWANP